MDDNDGAPVRARDLRRGNYFLWNLCDTKVHSNLGGLGPDSGPEELRFSAIGSIGDKT